MQLIWSQYQYTYSYRIRTYSAETQWFNVVFIERVSTQNTLRPMGTLLRHETFNFRHHFLYCSCSAPAEVWDRERWVGVAPCGCDSTGLCLVFIFSAWMCKKVALSPCRASNSGDQGLLLKYIGWIVSFESKLVKITRCIGWLKVLVYSLGGQQPKSNVRIICLISRPPPQLLVLLATKVAVESS